ncbi:unannotated protein [freshwater metagenome]|uniref:Unannotated protein n=1 Tax=freshwater metagenome TaxID=449393 RepID=A0A6J6SIA1_9ZZZZ|nr:hypothetical protein [Actinomycetota bacterium]MSY78571.1 hypothetical protein [Actinomycetota bacterium]
MQIVSALFSDEIELRQAPGPSTRIDLTGIHFSAAAPSPFPVTVTPHLVVIVRNGVGEDPNGVLEVTFHREGEQVARNVQPIEVEPGKFAYRLVRGELEFVTAGTIEARCRIGLGEITVVPYTLLEPVT